MLTQLHNAGETPPLAGHPLFRVNDRLRLTEELHSKYGVSSVRFGPAETPFFALANRVALKGATLHYCRYDSPTQVAFRDMNGFRQLFCLSGSAQVHSSGRIIGIDGRRSTIMDHNGDFESHFSEGYSHVVLQLDPEELRRKLELIEGRANEGALKLSDIHSIDTSGIQRLRSITLALSHQLSGDLDPNSIVVSELVQALQTSFLTENAREFIMPRDIRHPEASQRQANALEAYIHAHWDRALTVEDIAAAAGVSVRSVFSRFKSEHGVGPMAYIRDVRLQHANRLLSTEDSDVSVMDVALRCGFASLGHFASRYEQKFGELPSATLARRRQRRLR